MTAREELHLLHLVYCLQEMANLDEQDYVYVM